jgi:hypothetical protein
VYHNVIRKPPRPPDPPEPPEPPEAKDRVIHTRVPESLEAELRERAHELGMSVSNLVRNVLGHAFGLVGDVAADAHAIARAAKGDKKPIITPPPAAASATSIDDVLGWQPIVLGKNALCARCNAILPRGDDAAVGVGTQLVVCPPCLKELRS